MTTYKSKEPISIKRSDAEQGLSYIKRVIAQLNNVKGWYVVDVLIKKQDVLVLHLPFQQGLIDIILSPPPLSGLRFLFKR